MKRKRTQSIEEVISKNSPLNRLLVRLLGRENPSDKSLASD